MKCYTKSTKCTDVLWLCLFLVFSFFLLAVSILSIYNGNYLAIINGYDTFGNICGVHQNKPFKNVSLSGRDTSKTPYVLYFALEDVANVLKICVSECPEDVYGDEGAILSIWIHKDVKYCRYDFDMPKLVQYYQFMNFKSSAGPCPRGTIRQSYVIKQRCIPIDNMDDVFEIFSVVNSIFQTISLVFINLYLTWPYILALGVIAFFICLTFVLIIWWQHKFFSWIICVLVLIANGGFSALLWYDYESLSSKDQIRLYFLFGEYQTNERVVYAAAVLSSIITILLSIVLAFIRKHISQTVILFNDAVICLKHLKEITVYPLITLIAFIGYIYFWTYVMLCITTANSPTIVPFIKEHEKDDKGLDRYYDEKYRVFTQVQYVAEQSIRSLWWTYVMGLIWSTQFIFACEDFCLDATVGFWYSGHMNCSTKNVLKLLLRFHLGTVAKGSLIFPILRGARLLLEASGKILSIVKLEVGCKLYQSVESFRNSIECFKHYLYAVVAMETTDICSAKMETKLIMPPEVETMSKMTNYALFLAKLTVANLVGLIGMVLLRSHRDDLYFYMAPVLFSMILAFYIAHVILSLIEKVIDTILFCASNQRHGRLAGGRLDQTNLAGYFEKNQVRVKEVTIQVVKIPVRPMLSE